LALRGDAVSMEGMFRMVTALGLKLQWDLIDPRRKQPRPSQDLVHSAIGEFEARHFTKLGLKLAMDHPYQHYQFAGRADLIAWDVDARQLLHVENRTRFPDFQAAAGAFNAKRAYLGASVARQLGIGKWRGETHVIAALWSAEVLHAIRLRAASFTALCPDDSQTFARWWQGRPDTAGQAATLIVLDPLARGRQRPFISLDEALTARPRYAGYADAAEAITRLTGRSTNAA
jgi:hypothetical protein